MKKSTILAIALVPLLALTASAQEASWLGVGISDGPNQGVRVESVEQDSPAARAGVEDGDVIVAFDGQRVIGMRQLTRLVRETPVGRTVDVTVLRNSQEQTFSLTTAAQTEGGNFRFVIPDDLPDLSDLGDRIRDAIPRIYMVTSTSRLGLRAVSMTEQLREYFGADADEGVLVSSVDEGSAAADADLRAGDVVIAIDGRTVDEPSDLRRRPRTDRTTITLTIIRDRAEQEVNLDVPPSRRQE